MPHRISPIATMTSKATIPRRHSSRRSERGRLDIDKIEGHLVLGQALTAQQAYTDALTVY